MTHYNRKSTKYHHCQPQWLGMLCDCGGKLFEPRNDHLMFFLESNFKLSFAYCSLRRISLEIVLKTQFL